VVFAPPPLRKKKEYSQLKYIDTHVVAVSPNVTPVSVDLSAIAQGVAQSQRVSETVMFERADVCLQYTQSTADFYASVRVVMFIWNQNNTSIVPGPNSVLENPATTATLSMYNWQGRQEYQILADHVSQVSGSAAFITTRSYVLDKFVVPLGGRRAMYDGSALTGSKHLYLLYMSDSALPPNPTLTFLVRLWYWN